MKTQELETLLGKYIAKNGQVNPQFTKQVKLLSESDKKKVWHEVKVRELDKQRDRVRRQYLSQAVQTLQTSVSEPVVSEPVVSEPVVSEPVVSEPVVAEPVVAEPVVSEPVVAEPVVNVVAEPLPASTDDEEDEDDEDDEEEEDEEELTSKSRGPGRGPRIMWTEDEWDKLAETVYGMRRKNPVPALAKFVNRAMKQMPEDRRRNLQGTTLLKPLIDRLRQMEADDKAKAEDYDRYRSQIQQMGKIPTREEIINSLTEEELDKIKPRVVATLNFDTLNAAWKDKILANLTEEEILARFSQTVFDNHTPDQLMKMVDEEDVLACLPFSKVFGFVAEHFMESLGQFGSQFSHLLTAPQSPVFKQRPPATYKQPEVAVPRPQTPATPATPAIPKVTRVEKPKVTVIGLKGGQEQTISQQLGNRCDLTFIESEAKSKVVPDGQTAIVLWARFTNHCLQSKAKAKAINGTRLITHHGGLREMVEKIEQVLSGETVQPIRPGSGVGVN